LTIEGIQIWSKALSGDRTAFVFLNPQPYGTPSTIKVSLKDLGLIMNSEYRLYEMFSGDALGDYKASDIFKCIVEPSGSVYTFWAEPTNTKRKATLKTIVF